MRSIARAGLSTRRRWAVVVASLTLVAAVTVVVVRVSAGTHPAGHGMVAATGGLPVLTSAGATPSAGDLGDPDLLTVPAGPTGPARYVLFGTGSWNANVPTATSTDLRTWTTGPDALPTVPRWSRTDRYHSHIWAPAVTAVGDHWLMYVTVPDPASGRQCLAVTEADSPAGPYHDALGHPLICQRTLGGSIDASVTETRTGAVLLWKSDGNCCGQPSTLWSQQLRADGLATVGAAHALLSDSQAWQRGIIEEPAAVPDSRGGWWLFYSGALFDTPGYSIGVASCATLAGPCTDRSTQPYQASVAGQRSPGGLETFTDLDGRLRAVFDTWTQPTDALGIYTCCRAIDLATLEGL